MELITTHVGADFDAFASAVAARRLHPRAQLFFPGSREESVRRMLASGLVELRELKRREIDPRAIAKLVLCDIRQRERLGVVAEWLDERRDLEVWAYDHHPDASGDVPVGAGVVDATVGATSTLIAEEFGRQGLAPTPVEATLLLLGIYEDTGSLTFPTTSPRDLAAASWLLARGGDLAAVRRFATQQLDATHLAVLHRMVEGAEIVRLHGHRLGVAAVELGRYVEELAPLVSRCLDLLGLPLFFGVFGEGERATVIARGEVAGVDLGTLLAELGGGGHPTAASVALRGATAIEARERLLGVLERRLPQRFIAAQLMIRNFCRVPASATVAAAKQLLQRQQINSAPVLSEGRVVGAVTRQQLDAALHHGLGERGVEAAMSSEVSWVAPEAGVEEVGRALLARPGRFVLVGEKAHGEPAGLISRMAWMTHLYAGLEREAAALDRRFGEQRERHRQLGRWLSEHLPEAAVAALAAAGEVARQRGERVYLVGGSVRDLLLDRPNQDLDLVVEGDGLAFARALAARLGGRAREHEAFLTAAVVAGDGLRVDVATARSEYYRAPAALPEVTTSVLRQDLYRRDFTINTLAIHLDAASGPELVDYFGGGRDLEARTLRVLHALSFLDDPTRMLRAVRFELRLGFRLAPETQRLIGLALREGALARLSGSRLREELALLFEEPVTLLGAVERLDELDLLSHLIPGLTLDERLRSRLRHLSEVDSWFRLAGFARPPYEFGRLALLGLVRDLSREGRAALVRRLQSAGVGSELLLRGPERVASASRRLANAAVRPHDVVSILRGLAGEEILLLMAESDALGRERLRHALGEALDFQPRLKGRDLVAAGVEPGPAIGRALAAVWAARVDGDLGEAEELAYALRFLRCEATASAAKRRGER